MQIGSPGPEVTLRVYHGRQEIFTSTGKWLHPLFELEEFLLDSEYSPETLLLEDKIVGKAAALLLVRLGIRRIRAGVLSRLGLAVLENNAVQYAAEHIVQRIECRTEEILSEVEDPQEAYGLLKARAGR
jgi:zinc transport system ATP-binding protein